MVVVVETPNADGLVVAAGGLVVGLDVTLVVLVLGDDVERVDGREVGTYQPNGRVFIVVDLPDGAVDGGDEAFLALVAEEDLAGRVVEKQDVRLAVEEHLARGVDLAQLGVRLRVEDGAVAADHAVLLEDAHLVDDAALDAVGRLEDLAVLLVLDVHCAFARAAEDQVRRVLRFGPHLALGH